MCDDFSVAGVAAHFAKWDSMGKKSCREWK
jgi:hypothetical protein